jgi:hypothetical protein
VSFDALRTGAVIRFPYLWSREAVKGESEGRKFRPVTVGVRVPKPGGDDVLVLFPITSQAPARERFAVEIPVTEKRRAGLDEIVRLWIVLDEYNQDVIGRSFYLKPEPPLGYLSKAFFLPLLQEFVRRRAQAKAVDRSL